MTMQATALLPYDVCHVTVAATGRVQDNQLVRMYKLDVHQRLPVAVF